MNILVLGGTRFFGVHMVSALLNAGHEVTIATRGNRQDNFGNCVHRVIVDHNDAQHMKAVFSGKDYDVVCDNLTYCSNDVKYALDSIQCKHYILMSSTAVYDLHDNIVEEEFNPKEKQVIWNNRDDFPYGESKRFAEIALFNAYPNQESSAVRYPFVIGKDDYTHRLSFYVNHVMNGIPMDIDNLSSPMSFITSSDAGRFLCFMAEQHYTGPINGSCHGTISIQEILSYIELKTGKLAIIDPSGEKAPYNGTPRNRINTEKAQQLGFVFSEIKEQIFPLIDTYIDLENSIGKIL